MRYLSWLTVDAVPDRCRDSVKAIERALIPKPELIRQPADMVGAERLGLGGIARPVPVQEVKEAPGLHLDLAKAAAVQHSARVSSSLQDSTGRRRAGSSCGASIQFPVVVPVSDLRSGPVSRGTS